MRIGGYIIDNPIALAPMAGITDKPFRRLCRDFGAGWAVCEMLTSDPTLRNTKKTLHRSDFTDEGGVAAVQIAGSDPQQMADAARYNVSLGAQVIDINMGCPAKKVCNVQAGSALMQNEPLVAAILEAVVRAVDVPVTLKTRLGWHDDHKNLPAVARIAEDCGIAALAVHGRTRTQMYKGEAAYDLIAETKCRLNIPVWVNGDITSPQKAQAVLKQTAADGISIFSFLIALVTIVIFNLGVAIEFLNNANTGLDYAENIKESKFKNLIPFSMASVVATLIFFNIYVFFRKYVTNANFDSSLLSLREIFLWHIGAIAILNFLVWLIPANLGRIEYEEEKDDDLDYEFYEEETEDKKDEFYDEFEDDDI